MRAIFISYRREDAEGQAGRLFDDLVTQFGEAAVFMDVAGIEPGRDFRRAIDEQVASCGVLLALIGKSWLDAKDESGRGRLDDPMDFVRLETASALKRDIPVIVLTPRIPPDPPEARRPDPPEGGPGRDAHRSAVMTPAVAAGISPEAACTPRSWWSAEAAGSPAGRSPPSPPRSG